MIRGELIHPDLLAGLARLGHGSQVLVADALFPHATGVRPDVPVVRLNVAPGLVAAPDLVRLVAGACWIERCTWMQSPEGLPDAVAEYRIDLADHRHWGGQEITWDSLERFAFYDACRRDEVGLLVATGEVRPYANLLMTIGVP